MEITQTTIFLFCKKVALSLLAFLTPIHYTLLAVGMFIMLDTFIGIWKAKKCRTKVSSRKLSRVIRKMLVYQLTIITFYVLDYAIINELVIVSLNVDFALTKLIGVVLISIELYSIDESFEQATGKGLYQRITDFVTKVKKIRKDVNNFRQDAA